MHFKRALCNEDQVTACRRNRLHLSFTIDMKTTSKAPSDSQSTNPHNTPHGTKICYFSAIHTSYFSYTKPVEFIIAQYITSHISKCTTIPPCSPSPPSSAISFSSSRRLRCLQLITNSSKSKTKPTYHRIPSPPSHQVILRTIT